MRLLSPHADVFVPNGEALDTAQSRSKALGVAAHPDDLELMALPAILAGHADPACGFAGLVVCDGAMPGAGPDEGVALRRLEQRAAAVVGRYSVMVQLGHASQAVQTGQAQGLAEDLVEVLKRLRPETLYSHNPADRHPSHLAVLLALRQALKRLDPSERPRRWLGCEVWGGLDWQALGDLVPLPLEGDRGLAQRLLEAHGSQLKRGKAYISAASGRRRANATFSASHSPDAAEEVVLAMDLSPLLTDGQLSLQDFLSHRVERFRVEAVARLDALGAEPSA
jgi:LmbE family N-acetylglucosaminyl deacetylase